MGFPAKVLSLSTQTDTDTFALPRTGMKMRERAHADQCMTLSLLNAI